MNGRHTLAACIPIAMFLAPPTSAKTRPVRVSLVALLANPEKYDGKLVGVYGYLHKKFEDSALYLSKMDGDFLIGKNALWVNYGKKVGWQPNSKTEIKSVKYFDCRHVLVVGQFDTQSRGHLGSYSGALKNVERVMELIRHYDGRKPLKP